METHSTRLMQTHKGRRVFLRVDSAVRRDGLVRVFAMQA